MTSLLLVAVLVGACGDDEEAISLDEVQADCDPATLDSTTSATLLGDNDSLILSAPIPDLDAIITARVAATCIVQRTDGSLALESRVAAAVTTPGDGSEAWNGFEADWSYSDATGEFMFTIERG